jgi:trk system potassium uptake protein TrkA
VKIFIIGGAGLIVERIVSALHADHELTVVDLDPARVKPLAQHYDVANLVAGTFARSAAPEAKTIVRTQSAGYVDIWREGWIDVDFVVSSELETARGVTTTIGMPAAGTALRGGRADARRGPEFEAWSGRRGPGR